MKRIFHIALREYIATVSTKAFILGLLVMPAIMVIAIVVGPRLFNFRNFQLKGEVAIIDPTGRVASEWRALLDPQKIAARRTQEAKQALEQVPESVRPFASNTRSKNSGFDAVLGPVPDIHLLERPANADLQNEKAWLIADAKDTKHLAIAVIHADAVVPENGKAAYGTYDLYVPANLDDRADTAIQQSLRDAIVNARVRARALDRDLIDAIVNIPRVQSKTVTRDRERQTVGGFNMLLPVAFSLLLFMGVIMGGQALVTSTVEEKSSRVIEVLLSAVSPMELMAGKILGQMAVSLTAMSLYLAMGMAALTSFALFGLLNPWLIFYLLLFFTITYLVFGSLLMAVGSAVNEMREAQSLMMPIVLVLVIPYALWMPISRDPNSTFSIAMSFIPPVNTFAMLLRMASVTPPPWWQVWLSIVIGIGSVFAAVWFTAKVFRIGLLMYGKPPDFATLIRWARSA